MVAQFSVFKKKIQPDIIYLCQYFALLLIQQIESLVLLAVLAMYRALFLADP